MSILDDILNFIQDGNLEESVDHFSGISSEDIPTFFDHESVQDIEIIDKISQAYDLNPADAEEFLEISQTIQHSLAQFGDKELLSNIDNYVDSFNASPESIGGLVNNIKGIYGEHEVYEQLKDKFGDNVLLVRDMSTNNPGVDFIAYDKNGEILEKIQVKITSNPEYILETRESLPDDIKIVTTKDVLNNIALTNGEIPEGIYAVDISNQEITRQVENAIHILKDREPEFEVLLHDPVLSEYIEQDYDPFGRSMYSDYKYRPVTNWTYSGAFENAEIPTEFENAVMEYDFDWNPDHFVGVGTPFEDAKNWMPQTEANSCAVIAQRNIIESVTGVSFSEEELCSFAENKGLYDPEIGTMPADMGAILKEKGFNVEDHVSADFKQLESALKEGNKVLVGLDASEVWYPLRDLENQLPVEQPSLMHCVQVTGIDYSSPNDIKVILSDPGVVDDGGLLVISKDDFMNAWKDSGYRMAEASLKG